MFSCLNSLNLLHKPLAQNLRIFNQFEAQSCRSLCSDQSIVVFIDLGVQSTDLQKYFAQISSFVQLVRKCGLNLLCEWDLVGVDYSIVQTVHVRRMEFTRQLRLTFGRNGANDSGCVDYAVVVGVQRWLNAQSFGTVLGIVDCIEFFTVCCLLKLTPAECNAPQVTRLCLGEVNVLELTRRIQATCQFDWVGNMLNVRCLLL